MKNSIITVVSIIFTAVGVASCQMNYSKSPSGMVYKIVDDKDGEKLKPGQIIKFHIAYTLSPKDSVLNSTFGFVPGYVPIDTGSRYNYSFIEIIPQCSVGDSVEFVLSVDSLKSKKMIPDYNNIFTRGGQITGTMKILKAFNNESEVAPDFQKEQDAEKEREIKSIEDYLAKNNIKAQKTKSGAFVSLEDPGDPGIKADSGKVASIKYKGYLQTNGKVFDTNMDTSKGHTDPINVQVGGRVIPAWNEALPYFGKGGVGKIFVPAMLGYGGQPSPEIPAYSNLIFDVHILDVKNAEAAPKTPPVNNQPPGE